MAGAWGSRSRRQNIFFSLAPSAESRDGVRGSITEMTEPPPTHGTGEGLGGSTQNGVGNGDGHGDTDNAVVDRHAAQDDDQTIPVPAKTSQLHQGPRITSPKSAQFPPPVPEFAAPFPPPDQQEARMATCRGLQATIMDFFVGASEQRIQVNASVYDLIYGSGPHAIMDAARGYHLTDMEPSFRWYHLPANNVCSLLLCKCDREGADSISSHKAGMGRGKGALFPRYRPKQGLIVSRISCGVAWLRATMQHGYCLMSLSTSLVYLAIGIRRLKLDD